MSDTRSQGSSRSRNKARLPLPSQMNLGGEMDLLSQFSDSVPSKKSSKRGKNLPLPSMQGDVGGDLLSSLLSNSGDKRLYRIEQLNQDLRFEIKYFKIKQKEKTTASVERRKWVITSWRLSWAFFFGVQQIGKKTCAVFWKGKESLVFWIAYCWRRIWSTRSARETDELELAIEWIRIKAISKQWAIGKRK